MERVSKLNQSINLSINHVAGEELRVSLTRSSATAEKQRVSCASTYRLSN